jgi:hypothetical protein
MKNIQTFEEFVNESVETEALNEDKDLLNSISRDRVKKGKI